MPRNAALRDVFSSITWRRNRAGRAQVAEEGLPQKTLIKAYWKLLLSVKQSVLQAKQLNNILRRSRSTLSVQALTPLYECALIWASGQGPVC